MINVFTGVSSPGACKALDNMHRDRKRVFVDLLHWEVPVIDGEFEADQFDTCEAIYLVETRDGEHCGSFRMLRTDRPHILGSLFPHLCDEAVPAGADILEITRGCVSPRLRAGERLRVRNRLMTAAVEYGLRHGISRFTCVADSGWLAQILAMGWDCRPLGAPRPVAGVTTGALEIRLSDRTLEQLIAAGNHGPALMVEMDPGALLAA